MILKELSETLSLLNRVLDYESFDDVDMVIEVCLTTYVVILK